VTSNLAFHLLRDNSNALLSIHFHSVGGNIGSGYRIPSYRALAASGPDNIHTLTFDYRGFGKIQGVPTEEGIIQDAIVVGEWVLYVAKITLTRILIFGQSLGTAVNMAVAEHFASRDKPIILPDIL
jgi:abhydrolase domain-containing protein 12